jgi:hypothetical protein
MRDGPPEPLAHDSSRSDGSPPGRSSRVTVAADPFCGVKAPKVNQPVVEFLTDDELRALIKACAALDGIHGPDFTAPGERLHHRRDEMIVRLMFEGMCSLSARQRVDRGETDHRDAVGVGPSAQNWSKKTTPCSTYVNRVPSSIGSNSNDATPTSTCGPRRATCRTS